MPRDKSFHPLPITTWLIISLNFHFGSAWLQASAVLLSETRKLQLESPSNQRKETSSRGTIKKRSPGANSVPWSEPFLPNINIYFVDNGNHFKCQLIGPTFFAVNESRIECDQLCICGAAMVVIFQGRICKPCLGEKGRHLTQS
ncbi:hypothetical protein CEXT_22981 [Caerostris extrusa]|uniref:Uncharacterized protein n=1 Tax=Caerostris extrusa TaxID=172846 RepID=A0AAV4XHD5_CAEEX|nr:hypothetical protein CEXT_22981 [Caerostris extrusa]